MADEPAENDESDGTDRPDFLRPGIRCGLEMVLAAGLVLLVGLPAENVIYYGVVVTSAVVVMVVVLFWAVNRQMERWMEATVEQSVDEVDRRMRLRRQRGD